MKEFINNLTLTEAQIFTGSISLAIGFIIGILYICISNYRFCKKLKDLEKYNIKKYYR